MMHSEQNMPLKIIDGLLLEPDYKEILQPDEEIANTNGVIYRLPRFFYKVNSWEEASKVKLSAHFYLSEFLTTDFREVELLRSYPKYVPITICYTASILELFRHSAGRIVRIASNGGYRSPKHLLNNGLSPHSWGTAANIYKIGATYLDNKSEIEKYSDIAKKVLPGAWVRSYGTDPGTSFDQLHIDMGFTTVHPKIHHII